MSQDNTREKQERRDFFISYTGQDKPWAEWIAAQLDAAGYSFFFQAWDFRPSSNFVAEMDNATRLADRTLVVLSGVYLASGFAFSEWAAAFAQDPTGNKRHMLPVRIEPCEVRGLLGQVVYIDLVDCKEEQARKRLLEGAKQEGRVRPTHVPFPVQQGAPVAFPGTFPAHWNIPFARNPFFIGREELLERLHAQLQTTQAAVALSQTQAISRLGGIGKTQLAIEYAYRYGQEYQTVLWVRAETTEAWNASYAEIAALLQLLSEKDMQEQSVIVQAVKNWLGSTSDWLLILDNADDLNIVPAFLPTRLTGHLLLTTRAQITGKMAQRFEVDTLNVETGALLLLRRAGVIARDGGFDSASPSDRAIAMTLSEELGGLPLALDQAGAYIEETQCSLEDYQQQYHTRRAELLAHRGMLVDDHPEPVATTWSLSFAKVEQANLAAVELLQICAFLAPDEIPEELLVEASKTPRLISGETIIAGQLDEMVALLRTYSLVQRNHQKKMISIHRLVQATIQDNMEKETQRTWAERVICAVDHIFPDKVNDVKTWPQCRRCLPHAIVSAELIQRYGFTFFEAAELLNQVGYYLREQARYEEAEKYLRHALSIIEKLGQEHVIYRTRVLNSLARLFFDQYKYADAASLYEQELAIREQELGPEHPKVIRTLNSLALNYWYMGNGGEKYKYTVAEALYERALPLSKQKLGPEHPQTLLLLHNQALLFRSLGKYEQAIKLNQQVLEIRERKLGMVHLEVARSLQSLAVTYHEQGDQSKYEEAERLLKRALAIREQLLSAKHPQTAKCINYLAHVSLSKEV